MIRIGTRGSALARWQAAFVADHLRAHGHTVVLEVVSTVGDRVRHLPFAQVGNSDLDYGFLLSENRDIVGSAALMFHTHLHLLPRLTLDVGPQGYLALLSDIRKTDVFAVALGASARYGIVPRWHVSLFGSAFYSPGVLTFGSADDLYDLTAGARMRFTRHLAGLAGYRWLKFTTSGEPSVYVQNEVFVGLAWKLR